MTLQNRVNPFGEILAVPARGSVMGNRGCLHNENRQLGGRRWDGSKPWLLCRIEWKGIKRLLMSPGRYTELFFLDEATALAAGHRYCNDCNKEKRLELLRCASIAYGKNISTTEFDQMLKAQRINALEQRILTPWPLAKLPDGAVFLTSPEDRRPCLWHQDRAWLWDFSGYQVFSGDLPRTLHVITPEVTLNALAAGFKPAVALHDQLG